MAFSILYNEKTICRINEPYANIIGHMCYAAFKLWNVCNYERMHYKKLNLSVSYPNWYYRKSAHKDDIWYKSLPAQTAQEVCKQLDKSWQSFYALHKSKGIEKPRPPRFKQENMAITYVQICMRPLPAPLFFIKARSRKRIFRMITGTAV